MVDTDEVRFGKHSELCYLPQKVANFFHEFRATTLLAFNCL